MGKVKAPRPTPRIVKVAPSEAQIEVRRSLCWRQANTAAQEFLAAVNDAHDSLIEFSPVTEEHIGWLKDAVFYVVEYLNELDRFETRYEVNKFYSDHKSGEAESIAELLCRIKCYNDDSLDFEYPDIPEGLRKNIFELIDEKMELVGHSGWNMYHVFIGAV